MQLASGDAVDEARVLDTEPLNEGPVGKPGACRRQHPPSGACHAPGCGLHHKARQDCERCLLCVDEKVCGGHPCVVPPRHINGAPRGGLMPTR